MASETPTFPAPVTSNPVVGSAVDPSGPAVATIITERDIVFDCPRCNGELVVDLAGVGMTLACSHCGQEIVVPDHPPGPREQPAPIVGEAAGTSRAEAPAAGATAAAEEGAIEQLRQRIEVLRMQLKENQSQSTETRGHINRATIELHRHQLRLQKLQTRQESIETELKAALVTLGQRDG